VEVEAVIPPDDLSEPCYEAETVQLIREVQERAQRGDVEASTSRLTRLDRPYLSSLNPGRHEV